MSVVEEHATTNHPRTYASIPINHSNVYAGRDISYRQFANAINRCTHWLRSQIGLESTEIPLAYVGPSDLRYQILSLAAAKSGHVVRIHFLEPLPHQAAIIDLAVAAQLVGWSRL